MGNVCSVLRDNAQAQARAGWVSSFTRSVPGANKPCSALKAVKHKHTLITVTLSLEIS